MTDDRGDDSAKLNEAGAILINMYREIKKITGIKADDSLISEESEKKFKLARIKVKSILAEIDMTKEKNKDLENTYQAIMLAVNSYDESNDGLVRNSISSFNRHVDAKTGGPQAKNLGGKKIINKKSAKTNYMRAVLVVLWKYYKDHGVKEDFDRLVKDARKYLQKDLTKKKIARIVDNHDQKHDVDIKKTKSVLSVHVRGITELVENHNYRRLKDFI